MTQGTKTDALGGRLKTLLKKTLDSLYASYWFVPAVLSVLAVIAATLLVWIEHSFGSDLEWMTWLRGTTASGAQTLLSVVSGSMIGVAGVAFSITISSVVYASAQYGPRLLTNFMADRGNQVTLGTFVATFLYCLLVLQSVRSGDDPFVPHLAVLGALILAVSSVGVLIYFIHHIPQSIHVANVIARVGKELEEKIENLFPEDLGDDPDEERPRYVDMSDKRSTYTISSKSTGYVQAVDPDGLLAAACRADGVLRVLRRPGDFAAQGDPLAELVVDHVIDDSDTLEDLSGLFVLGDMRTAFQDVRFLVRELVEIAARALSPGVNDPRTAMDCVDWIGATLKKLSQRSLPESWRLDDEGTPRVVVAVDSYESMVQESMGQLRPYVGRDGNAADHAMKTLADILQRVRTEKQRKVILEEADRLLDTCEALLSTPAQFARLKETRQRLGS